MKIAVFLSRFPYPLIKGDKLSVAITDEYFDETKSDILFYYDKNLFVFQKED